MTLDGFVIDILRDDTTLIEIQTGSFAAMGRKLDTLLPYHAMHIVHPIAVEIMLHKPGARPRRSPRKNNIYSLFDELVSMPTLLDHPNLTIEVALVSVDTHQVADPTLSRGRGGWRTVDRRLRDVVSRHPFSSIDDLTALVPTDLPEVFTTSDLARMASIPKARAQKMAYCLRANGLLVPLGRDRRGVHYRRP